MARKTTQTATAHPSNGRIILFSGVVVLLFGVLVAQAYNLQIRQGEAMREWAERQTTAKIVIEPRRGEILDREYNTLAGNMTAYSVVAAPSLLKGARKEKAKEILVKTFGKESGSRLAAKIRGNGYFLYLTRHSSEEAADSFRKAVKEVTGKSRLRGLYLHPEQKRVYPFGALASPIMGLCNIDNQGVMGLERKFNDILCGESVELEGMRNNRGEVATSSLSLSLEVPAGNSLVLTLDKTIQYETEKIVSRTMEENEANWVSAVTVDVHTGEILALAQAPGFDVSTDQEGQRRLFRNVSVENAVEPGSTLKVITIGAALEEKLYPKGHRIDAEKGQWRFGGYTIHDTHDYGEMTLKEIMAKSSNIASAKIGVDLGAKRLYGYLKDWGFGQKTGLGLPSETSGLVRDPAKSRWYPIDLANVAFGQGIIVSPLQMATAIAGVANGGLLMKPILVKEVLDENREVIQTNGPTVVRRVISPAAARELTDMMVAVTQEGGTGTNARLHNVKVAGKTGTAQKFDAKLGKYSKELWTSWFVGFAPADNPQVAVVVVVDEPKAGQYYGGQVAGPAFSEILRSTLDILASKRVATR